MKVNFQAAVVVAVLIAGGVVVTMTMDSGYPVEGSATDSISSSALISDKPDEPKVSVPFKTVTKLEIDLEKKQVHIPGEGWIEAKEFWDIYYNQPQRLPGDIDFERLQKFEEITGTDRVETEEAVDPKQPDEMSNIVPGSS